MEGGRARVLSVPIESERGSRFCFVAFSSREPASTSLENALVHATRGICAAPSTQRRGRAMPRSFDSRNRSQAMKQHPKTLTALALSAVMIAAPVADTATACTRTLFVGTDNTVITGRNMDWEEDMSSNLWVFPAG